MTVERWRRCPVKGCQELYKVSDQGRVRRVSDDGILSMSRHNGSYAVYLRIDKKHRKKMSVARLVLMTWRPIENNRSYDVCWADGDLLNNRLENLSWVLHQPNAKFTPDQVRKIRARAAKGETNVALSHEYQVNEMTIGYIVNRVSYTNVEDIDETSI